MRRAVLLLFFLVGSAEPITNNASKAVTETKKTKQLPRRIFPLGQTGAARAVRTIATRRLTATSVMTFSGLEVAIADGDALIDIAVDTLTFTDQIDVQNGNAVEITSATAAVLDGDSAVRLFLVYGDLTLRALSIANGAVSTSSGCSSPCVVFSFSFCGRQNHNS